MTQTNIVIGIIALLLVIGAGVLYLTSDETMDGTFTLTDRNATSTIAVENDSETGDDINNTNLPPETRQPATASVMLTDNEPGPIMNVAYANLTSPGFVNLYSVNSQGKVTMVGSSDLLAPGVQQNLKIQTSNSLVEDQSLVAVVFSDTNDDGEFTDQVDMPMRANGIIVTDIDIVGRATANETSERLEQVKMAIQDNMAE